jgi:hypothetical protein
MTFVKIDIDFLLRGLERQARNASVRGAFDRTAPGDVRRFCSHVVVSGA